MRRISLRLAIAHLKQVVLSHGQNNQVIRQTDSRYSSSLHQQESARNVGLRLHKYSLNTKDKGEEGDFQKILEGNRTKHPPSHSKRTDSIFKCQLASPRSFLLGLGAV